MANIREALEKGIATLNVKTNSFVEERKCRAYISTLKNEIKRLKIEIGTKVYEDWKEGEEFFVGLEQLSKSIDEKYQEIKVQEERIRKIKEEEEEALKNN